jgi:hypothetical protein
MKLERFNPKEVQGKQALFVVNVEPVSSYAARTNACSHDQAFS